MNVRKGTQLIVSLIAVALMFIPLTAGSVATVPIPGDSDTVSYIVQAADLETAADAVRAVGGEITHELGVIKAVGADLTLGQLRRLEAQEGIVLYENQGVQVSDTEAGLTVRDEFTDLSYANNDGTVAWQSGWVEWYDDGSPESGDVTITDGRLQMRVDYSAATRAVDLSGATAATLSFDFVSVDNGNDIFLIDVSNNGGDSLSLIHI